VLAGGALLGWIAGGMMITDIAVIEQIGEPGSALKYGAAVAGALLVVALGELGKRRQRGRARAAH